MHNKLLLGSILYLISAGISVSSNILVKKMMIQHQIPAWEAIAIRQTVICAILLPFMVKTRFSFINKQTVKWNVIRNILYAISIGIMHIALFYIPINNGTSMQFLTPIIASILACFILKEPKSWLLWSSLCVCVSGALIIQQPSFDDSAVMFAYLLLFVSILLKSIITVLNRKLALQFNVATLIFYMHTIVLLVSLCFFYEFIKVPFIVWLTLGIVGIAYLLEYILIYTAYKHCTVTLLQPLEFSKIIYSIIISQLILGETTTLIQIIGSFIIICGFSMMLVHVKKTQSAQN